MPLVAGLLILVVFMVLPGVASAAQQGPVAAYSFDAGEGTTVEDVTGDGHEGTIEGAGWTGHGKFGDALSFDGEEGCVSIPDSETLQLTEEFTLEAWVRSEGGGHDDPIIFKESTAGSGDGKNPYSLYVGLGEDNRIEGFIGEEGEGGQAAVADPELLPRDVWTHVALTYDGARMRLYVDGELVDTTAAIAPEASTGPLLIGCDGVEGIFHGRIDEVRLYERALGEGEVDTDMTAPLQTPASGPVAAYSFDEGEGTTAGDATGNGHEGTVEGAGWTRGRYGDALEFSGNANECVGVPDSEDLKLGEEFTLEAWVKASAPLEEDPIIYKEHLGGEGFGNVGYALGIGVISEGRPEGFIGEGGGAFTDAGADPIEAGVWTHLAFTYDGRHMRVYENGELAGQNTQTTGPLAGGGPLYIGCDPNGSETFRGRIDEVRLYGRALSEGEIQADRSAPIQTPQRDPIAEYSFDQGEGTTLEDLSGNGHEGTIEGAGWTTHGRYGDALEFSGQAGECVTVPDSPALDLGEEFTLEAWVKPAALEAAPIIYKEHLGEEGFGNVGYSLGIGLLSDGRPEGFIGEGGGAFTDAGADPIEAGVWTHLAFTYDGRHMRIYENGELAGENTQTTGPLAAGGPLKIGCDGSYGNNFDGRIDEVRLYDRALGEGEVGADMEAPIQTPKQGPVAAYSFDEGEGTTAGDATGNGHEGTIEGAAWTRGRYGDALRFVQNEGRQCVTVADSPDLRLEEEFTLEAWVRAEEWLGSSSIVSKELEPGSEQSYSLGIGFTEYGRVEGWSENEVVYSPEPIEEDVWTHVAYTYDGQRARIYLDGELVSDKAVGPRELASTGPLDIGCDSPELGAQFSGRIDEVRLYDRALDGGEVATDMEAPIQTPKQGPVAAYSFDEGEGTTVEDLTGDGHTATIHGAGWTTHGRYGGAMEFDAAGESYLSIPDSPELDLTEEFTLEAWVRPGSGSDEWAPIIAKETGGGEASHELAYWLYEGDWESNQPYGGTEPAPGEKDKAHAEDPLPVDVWSHLALTYDGAKARLYVDGELIDCSPAPAGPPPVTDGELQIGGASELGDFFTGRIDEVRVYNRGLSQAEIQRDMNTTFPKAVTEAATEVESNDAMMTGTAQAHGPGTEYYFEYGPTTEYASVATGEEVEGDGEVVEVEETAVDLAPDTTYHYRLIAEGPLGTSYGKDKTFTTGARTIPLEQEEEEDASAPTGVATGFRPLAEGGGDFFGIDWDGDLTQMANPKPAPNDFARIAESGSKFVRFRIAPGEPGVPKAFEEAKKLGLTAIPYVGEGEIPPNKQDWFNYAKRIAKEQGVEFLEIGNEPNRPPSKTNKEGLKHAREFANYYEEMVREVGKSVSGVHFLLPGLYAYKPGKAGHITARAFLHQMKVELSSAEHPLAHPYQGISLHPYVFRVRNPKKPTANCPHPNTAPHKPTTSCDAEQVAKEIEQTIAGVRKMDPGTPIWVTEFGFPVGSSESMVPAVGEEEQAKLVRQSAWGLLRKRKHLNVAHAIYYNIQDRAAGPEWSHHAGLLDAHRKPREAWTAFTQVVKSQ